MFGYLFGSTQVKPLFKLILTWYYAIVNKLWPQLESKPYLHRSRPTSRTNSYKFRKTSYATSFACGFAHDYYNCNDYCNFPKSKNKNFCLIMLLFSFLLDRIYHDSLFSSANTVQFIDYSFLCKCCTPWFYLCGRGLQGYTEL